jgi:cytochrome c peroxidase
MSRSSLVQCALALVALAGCDAPGLLAVPDARVEALDAGPPETPPPFTAADRARFRTLAIGEGTPPPPDPSNRFADDPRAIALGRRLFFERGFAGALLDADNTGAPGTLGVRGETGRVSCEDCHQERADFADRRSIFGEISLGTGWTRRRSPSLLDVSQAGMVLWGGRYSSLWAQVFGALESPLEMNTSRLYVARFVAQHYRADYEAIFGESSLAPLDDTARFPVLSAERTGCRLIEPIDHPRGLALDPMYECHGMPGDRAEFDSMAPEDQDFVTRVVVNVGKAIAAFERTLACGPSRFDAFARGDDAALSAREQRGLALFFGRAGCATCHSGPYFSDQRFHNVGVEQRPTREGIPNVGDRGAAVDLVQALGDPLGVTGPYSDGDDGRLPTNVGPEHEGAFRTPTLRCVSRRSTFMHTGLVVGLDAAVAHFVRGGDPTGYPGTSTLEPLDLTREDRADLVAFLRALDPRS